jgi:exoribonuclease II
VEELMKRKAIEEVSKKELEDFVQNMISVKALPHGSKPAKSSWLVEAKVRERIESLVAFATDNCKSEDQRKIAKSVTFLIHALFLLLLLLLFFFFLQFR